jgi:hypothetical protein
MSEFWGILLEVCIASIGLSHRFVSGSTNSKSKPSQLQNVFLSGFESQVAENLTAKWLKI